MGARTATFVSGCLLLSVASLASCGGGRATTNDGGGIGGAATGGRGDGVATGGANSGTGGSATGGGPTGGAASGGRGGSGGSAVTGGMGGVGIGGTGGRAQSSGSGGCGFCPAVACANNAITLWVSGGIGAGGSSGGVLASLDVQASGMTFQCQRSGCTFSCGSSKAQLADGDYALSLSAPGYRTKTVHVHVANPTNCGCCGCCSFSTRQDVVLEPDGSPITGCCSDLVSDPANCGSCGKTCNADAWCANRTCTPVYSSCVGPNDGFASCDAYCAKQGKSCAAACGSSGKESLHWWGQGSVNCSDNIYSSSGTCSQSLSGYSGVRCCCEG